MVEPESQERGQYCGIKFAVESKREPSYPVPWYFIAERAHMLGIFECLRQETAHLGIQSIRFELRFFRTKSMRPDNV